jgi:hypothetical protein
MPSRWCSRSAPGWIRLVSWMCRGARSCGGSSASENAGRSVAGRIHSVQSRGVGESASRGTPRDLASRLSLASRYASAGGAEAAVEHRVAAIVMHRQKTEQPAYQQHLPTCRRFQMATRTRHSCCDGGRTDSGLCNTPQLRSDANRHIALDATSERGRGDQRRDDRQQQIAAEM